MAQTWIPTPWKRLATAVLNSFAGAARLLPGRQPAAIGLPGDVSRILVVELWNIGDVVLTMPFLAQLRVLFPRATTTLLAQSHARELLEGTGLVDEFIELRLTSTDSWLTYNPFAFDWRELRRLRRELRQRKFDLAFHCRTHIRERVVVAMSGARRRVGYAVANRDQLLTDHIPLDDPNRHKVADWLRLLEPFGGPVETKVPSLQVPESDRQWGIDYLAGHGVRPGDVVIGIHPGASLAEKRWPLDRFHATAEVLATRAGVRVLAFVEPAGYGASLGEIEGVASVNVQLRRLISLIDRCDLLVCNDSGPMHIAGALSVPTVAVFGFGMARWFSPLGEGHELVSVERARDHTPDDRRLADPFFLLDIPVSQVLGAVDRVLRRRDSSGKVPV
ncbi:MAG: glycosyltransferase family 9 protein [Gemmatimonadota bacterium]|nr:glycosyltransferase family 9 protein [Gemmatimonadota bacterium]